MDFFSFPPAGRTGMTANWLLAAAPMLIILLFMIGLRWGAVRAGPAAWLAAVLIANLAFGASPRLLALAQVKALLLTLDVLLIVWNAFLLYRVTDAGGAIGVFAEWVPKLTQDRGMQALLIGWAFASFLQGVGGFGVPTAVIAPLLIGLGFQPIVAVALPSLGNSWSVTFGSLASSFQALQSATNLSWEVLASPAAIFLGGACLVCGMVVAHLADGWRSVRENLGLIVILAIAMGGFQYLLAVNGIWSIAGLGGGIAGLGVGMLFVLRGRSAAERREFLNRRLGLALSGYAALVLLTLLVQLPWVIQRLDGIVLRVHFPALTTGLGYTTPAGYGRQIYLLRHAGSILAYSSAITYLLYRRAGALAPGAWRDILGSTVRRMLPSSLGILTLVSMAVIMAHAGMTDLLATGIASAVGTAFPLVSSWIGALGAFMTGSNTNSNVVFAQLQMRTAQLLGLSVPFILAAQTAGGALGSVIAPAKIIVGTATGGLSGQEGKVLRRMLPYTVILLGTMSLLALIFRHG
jgi:lactate permease